MKAFPAALFATLVVGSAVALGVKGSSAVGRQSCFVPSLTRVSRQQQPGSSWVASRAAARGSSSRGGRRSAPVMRLGPREDDVPIADRLLSTIPYLLPIADGERYGRFLAFYFPQVAQPIYNVIGPFISIYKSSPFVGLAIYLGLIYIGRTNAVSRYVRFNIQQSLVLSVALILPTLFFALIQDAPLFVQEPLNNTIFFSLLACIGYVGFSLALGEKPNQIPVVSEAAEMAVGPF